MLPRGMDTIVNAAIAKYVQEKGGFEFYRNRVDAARSFVAADGTVTLLGVGSKKVLAVYELDQLGLSSDEINSAVNTNEAFASIDDSPLIVADPRIKLGVISALVIVFGCFAPLITLPVMGSVNYIYNGRGDGVLALMAGVVALGLAATGRIRSLPFLGGGISVLVFSTLWNFLNRLSPFRGLADAAVNSIGLSWGWFFLIAGSVGLIVSGYADAVGRRIVLPEYCIWPVVGKLKYNVFLILAAAALAGLVVFAVFGTYLSLA